MHKSIFGQNLYGLVLTGDALDAFLDKAGKVLGLDPDDGEIPDYIAEAVFPGDAYTHNMYFDGEENEVDAIYYFDGNTEEPDADPVLVFTADREPDMFKASYKNIDELADEFRRHYGKYMPDNFNYKSHLGQVIGTVYCG